MQKYNNQLTLNERQQNLRIGLVDLIRDHVEQRGITKDELSEVVQGLDDVLEAFRFEDSISLDQALEDWILEERFKD